MKKFVNENSENLGSHGYEGGTPGMEAENNWMDWEFEIGSTGSGSINTYDVQSKSDW
jgi:hypothetical protein